MARRCIIAAAVLALVAACAPATAPRGTTEIAATSVSARDMILSGPSFDTALLAEVNTVRASHGLRPFAADRRLAGAARGHSTHMAQDRSMEHELAGRPGFAARIRASGAGVRTAGENILRSDLSRFGAGCQDAAAGPVLALGPALARDSVRRWMGSPRHRESILSQRFQRAGSGFAVVAAPNGCGQIYVAQVFGG